MNEDFARYLEPVSRLIAHNEMNRRFPEAQADFTTVLLSIGKLLPQSLRYDKSSVCHSCDSTAVQRKPHSCVLSDGFLRDMIHQHSLQAT
jgi:hypothetical protein